MGEMSPARMQILLHATQTGDRSAPCAFLIFSTDLDLSGLVKHLRLMVDAVSVEANTIKLLHCLGLDAGGVVNMARWNGMLHMQELPRLGRSADEERDLLPERHAPCSELKVSSSAIFSGAPCINMKTIIGPWNGWKEGMMGWQGAQDN